MEIKNVKISDINSEGFGVGRSENFPKVLFVKNAIMEEIVDVNITKEEKNFAFAEVLKTTASSPFRTTPKCQHFGACGGCFVQHISYKGQLDLKQKQVIDALKKFAKIENANIAEITPAVEEFHYRNKMDFAFSELAWITNEEENKERRVLGIHTFGRYDRVLNVKKCLLMEENANEVRNFIKEFCISRNTSFWNPKKQKGVMRDLIIRKNDENQLFLVIIFGEQPRVLQADLCMALKEKFPQIASIYWGVNKKESAFFTETKLYGFKGEDFLTQTLLGIPFKISLKSFAQVNSKMAEKMIEKLLLEGDFKPDDVVYDLYSGIGTFSLHVAKKVRKVIGVEASLSSVNDARETAKREEINNIKFFKGKVEDTLNDGFCLENETPNVVIVDPPRNGLDAKSLAKIMEIGVEKIIYISCNPASFARDASILKEKYTLSKVLPLDMFPQTTHVEVIGIFHK